MHHHQNRNKPGFLSSWIDYFLETCGLHGTAMQQMYDDHIEYDTLDKIKLRDSI